MRSFNPQRSRIKAIVGGRAATDEREEKQFPSELAVLGDMLGKKLDAMVKSFTSIPPPQIKVEPPEVTVQVPEQVVHVEKPNPVKWEGEIVERDQMGRIRRFTLRPVAQK